MPLRPRLGCRGHFAHLSQDEAQDYCLPRSLGCTLFFPPSSFHSTSSAQFWSCWDKRKYFAFFSIFILRSRRHSLHIRYVFASLLRYDMISSWFIFSFIRYLNSVRLNSDFSTVCRLSSLHSWLSSGPTSPIAAGQPRFVFQITMKGGAIVAIPPALFLIPPRLSAAPVV